MPLFERQYLTGSFYLYHSFSVIAALPLSFTLGMAWAWEESMNEQDKEYKGSQQST